MISFMIYLFYCALEKKAQDTAPVFTKNLTILLEEWKNDFQMCWENRK